MKQHVPIALKSLAVGRMQSVLNGSLGRREAEQMLKKKLRHSSKLREDLIGDLTADYDEQTAEALAYFRLI